jgi:hypothetical protein
MFLDMASKVTFHIYLQWKRLCRVWSKGHNVTKIQNLSMYDCQARRANFSIRVPIVGVWFLDQFWHHAISSAWLECRVLMDDVGTCIVLLFFCYFTFIIYNLSLMLPCMIIFCFLLQFISDTFYFPVKYFSK